MVDWSIFRVGYPPKVPVSVVNEHSGARLNHRMWHFEDLSKFAKMVVLKLLLTLILSEVL